MKKLSKILLTIIMLVFAINVVNADNCENVSMVADATGSGGSPFVRDAVKMSFETTVGGKKETVSEGRLLSFTDSSRELPTYCHNVSKPTGARYGKTTFKCTREIFDATTGLNTTDKRNVYDAGLMKILVTGYNVKNTGSGVVGYTATDLAVKAYELLWPSDINTNNMNSGEQKDYLKAYQYFANKMLDDAEVVAKLKEVVGSVRDKYANAISYTWVSNGDEIEAKAKELILTGLNAAKEFKSNGSAGISWNSNPEVSKDAVLGDGGVTNYSGSLAYTFKINGFTSKDAAASVKFTCANCNEAGVTYTVYANDEEVGKNYTGEIDLLKRVTNGTGSVTVKVAFVGASNKYGCEELDYKFELKYKDESITGEAYEMYSTDTSCIGNACQPLYVLRDSGVEKNVTIEDSFAMCTLTCEELKAKCEKDGSSSNACKEFKKQYPDGCVNCGVGLVNNVCANPGETSDLSLIEGYEVDPETCTQGTSENITGCIIDKKDAAGNSYQYIDNGVCTVSCKEDFHFKLPGNVDVSEKRHFALKVELKATKTCYLKMNGNADSVLTLFGEGAEETTEEYCNCAAAQAIAKLTADSFSEETKTASCEWQETYVYYGPIGKGFKTESSCEDAMYAGDTSIKNCDKHQGTKTSTKTIEYSIYEATYKYEKGCSSCVGSGTIQVIQKYETDNKCNVTSRESKDEAINAALSKAGKDAKTDCETLEKLTSKSQVKTYDVAGVGTVKPYVYSGKYSVVTAQADSTSIYNGLGAYNACALWDMYYDFDPEMYFYYGDDYMKAALTDKLDLIGDIKNLGTTTYYCRRDDGDAAYKLCYGKEDGWSNKPIFEGRDFCVCDTEGCKTTTIAVNATKRMKKSISYEVSYITPTQFYSISPHGEIVASLSGEGIENATELTNALPVGLGVSQNANHYALYAKNLGEYFGTGKSGRVWGNKNSVVAKTLKSNEQCFNNGDLKYDTKINDTYIDKGVWVCSYCPGCEFGSKCQKLNGKYYGPDGQIVDKATYKELCCPPDGCPIEIIYNGKNNYSYRPISSSNLNPNGRDLGPNWDYDENQVSTALEMKAYVTTHDILLDGDTIYDEGSHKYVMKVDMDSSMINTIKNRDNKEYTDNTLVCYDYVQDGKTYKNVFCYSTYLDELLSNSKTKDKITFGYSRPSSKSERNNSQASDYWTTWTERLSNSKWDVRTTKEISYYKSNYGEIGIGPSWK